MCNLGNTPLCFRSLHSLYSQFSSQNSRLLAPLGLPPLGLPSILFWAPQDETASEVSDPGSSPVSVPCSSRFSWCLRFICRLRFDLSPQVRSQWRHSNFLTPFCILIFPPFCLDTLTFLLSDRLFGRFCPLLACACFSLPSFPGRQNGASCCVRAWMVFYEDRPVCFVFGGGGW